MTTSVNPAPAPSTALVVQRKSKIVDSSGDHFSVPMNIPRLSGTRRGLDAAATNRGNELHFVDANGMHINGVLSQDRNTVRNRGRYEFLQGDAAHIPNQHASDVVGTGPRLQMVLDTIFPDDADMAKEISAAVERRFSQWGETCSIGHDSLAEMGGDSLAENLRIGVTEDYIAGESIDAFTSERSAPGMKLRLQPIQPEQVESPNRGGFGTEWQDGVKVDEQNRATHLCVWGANPGDPGQSLAQAQEYTEVPIGQVIHLFQMKQIGQHRGYPVVSASLGVIAQRRRWFSAVLSAAESAADVAAVLKTTASEVVPADIEAMDAVQWMRDQIMTLPQGWDLTQMKAEQPTAGHREYEKSLMATLGRPVGMPHTVAAMDASDSNMSSARRDDILYMAACHVYRRRIERRKLRKIVYQFLREAVYLFDELEPLRSVSLETVALLADWFWDAKPPLDALKHEKAITESLHNGTGNEIDILAEAGQDWDKHLKKLKRVAQDKLSMMSELLEYGDQLTPSLTPQQVFAILEHKPATVTMDIAGEAEPVPVPKGKT